MNILPKAITTFVILLKGVQQFDCSGDLIVLGELKQNKADAARIISPMFLRVESGLPDLSE